jgi:Helix-turn-helix domain
MSASDEMFNPYGLPAIRIPLAMITYDGSTSARKSLSWGAKALYGRLAFFLGKPKAGAFCNPDLKTIAEAMRTSTDTIGRWLDELSDHGFIERKRRGRGPSECIFRPHRCLITAARQLVLNSAGLRNQDCDSNSAELRSQDSFNTAELRNHGGESDSATLPVQFRNSAAPIPQPCGFPIKKENIQENVHENSRAGESATRYENADHALVLADYVPYELESPGGRRYVNPEYRRIEDVLRKAAPRTSTARDPRAYVLAIIERELRGQQR